MKIDTLVVTQHRLARGFNPGEDRVVVVLSGRGANFIELPKMHKIEAHARYPLGGTVEFEVPDAVMTTPNVTRAKLGFSSVVEEEVPDAQ